MRQPTRKLLARSLIALVALLLLLEAASFRWWFAHHSPRTTLHLEHGAISYLKTGADRNMGDMGWQMGRQPFAPTWDTLLASRRKFAGVVRTRIPLWPVILLSTGAALWATHRARPPRGHCPECRYNLRGIAPTANGSLTCPECGHTSAALPAPNNTANEGQP